MPGFMRFCAVFCKECCFLIAHRSHDIRRDVSKTVLVTIVVTKPNVLYLLAGLAITERLVAMKACDCRVVRLQHENIDFDSL